MGSVFPDANGILLVNYLEKDKTTIGEYCSNLLDGLSSQEKTWFEEGKNYFSSPVLKGQKDSLMM